MRICKNLVVFFAGLAIALALFPAGARADESTVVWEKYGTGNDRSQKKVYSGVATYGDSTYFVGTGQKRFFLSTSDVWRIEKRKRVDGEALWSLSSGDQIRGSAADIAADSSGFYAVGYEKLVVPLITTTYTWKIKKYNHSGSQLWSKDSVSGVDVLSFGASGPSTPYSVAADDTGIYVGGMYNVNILMLDFVTYGRLEKRSLGSGNLIWEKEYDPTVLYVIGSGRQAVPREIAVSDGKVYIGGYFANWSQPTGQSFLEIRNTSDGIKIVDKYDDLGSNGHIEGLAVTENYLYAGGSEIEFGDNDSDHWIIQKRDLDDLGIEEEIDEDYSSANETLYDLAAGPFGLYAVGKARDGSNADWRVEKRNLENLSIDPADGGWGVTESFSSAKDEALAVAVDNTEIYVGGFWDNDNWRAELRGDAYTCGLELYPSVDPPPVNLSEGIGPPPEPLGYSIQETDESSFTFCDCPGVQINQLDGPSGLITLSPNPYSAEPEPVRINYPLSVTTGTLADCNPQEVHFEAVCSNGDPDYSPINFSLQVVKTCNLSCSPIAQTVYGGQTAYIRAAGDIIGDTEWSIVSGSEYVTSAVENGDQYEVTVDEEAAMIKIEVSAGNCCGSATCQINVTRAGWIETSH